MKSTFFSKEFIPTNNFEQHINRLESLSINQLSVLGDWIMSTTEELNPSVEDVRKLSRRTGLSAETIASSLSLSLFILARVCDHGDEFSSIFDDMVEQKLISPENYEKLLNYFNNMSDKGREILLLNKQAAFESGIIPEFSNEAHALNFRLVLDNTYHDKDLIEQYNPIPALLVPLATINIRSELDGEQQELIFQVSSRNLEKLINSLQACQKEMRLLESISEELNIVELFETRRDNEDERQGGIDV